MTQVLAKILSDSISPDGVRLTTLEIRLPRIVLVDFNTHRVFSRNSASSRAIPVEKMIQRALNEPYIPEVWGKNGRGMQAKRELSREESQEARKLWLKARDQAVEQAQALLQVGVHKESTNRLLEPFLWQTVIVTATDWSNFLHLRAHPEAHPALRKTALAIKEVLEEHHPNLIEFGGWHLPLIQEEEMTLCEGERIKISIARCARVSYLTHDGRRDLQADLDLYTRLLENGHLSPFEHVAMAIRSKNYDFGNFRAPWLQYRKMIPGEEDILRSRGV